MNDLMRWLLNLPPQASTYAARVDGLHYFVIVATMLGSFGVFAVATWFLFRYRRGAAPPPPVTPRIEGTLGSEALTIGALLTLFIAFWIIGFRQFIHIRTMPTDAMEVYVMGKQWMWKFAYPGGQSSVGVLYVPAGRPVKLVITSRDVIHSFYVPAFRMKQDAVPGQYTLAWFEAKEPGTYPIACAEYCGAMHSYMMGDVVALPASEYEAWLAHPEGFVAVRTPRPSDHEGPYFSASDRTPLIAQGEKAMADSGCLRCHSIDGTPHLGPTFSGLYLRREKLAGGGDVVADEAYLTESMMDPGAKLVEGFDNIMPSYRGQLEPVQVGAILHFIKSLHPNDARAAHPNPLPLDGGTP